jgi:arsenate reductase
MEKRKILFLCTGNSCRSQMAEGFAHEMGWHAYSAGTKPEIQVNPFAVKVMEEMGIDIAAHMPEPVSTYLEKDFDIVATVCDNAQKACPVFTGRCKQKIHHGFIDPADATGSDAEITEVYRQVRDEIREWMAELLEV